MIRRTACLIARGQEPYRNLAIEKHLLDTLPEDTAILYLCQNRHAILLGRSQNPWYELKVESFTASGGQLARRLSGGGAVYQDMGNLNFTFILPKTAFDISRQLGVVGMAVGAFGIQPHFAGRNNLCVMGRKFSGNAYYKSGSTAMHHGTLLVDTDLSQMARFLTSDEKKNGSVDPATRLLNLSTVTPRISIDELEEALYWAFARAYGAQPAWLDEQMLDSRSIEALTAQFKDENWIYPENVPYTFSVEERFPWGGVTVKLNVEGGIIRSAKLYTDAMEAPLFGQLEQALIGSPFLISAISGRFDQKLKLLTDSRLLQLAGDVCNLICGRIRALDRQGQA